MCKTLNVVIFVHPLGPGLNIVHSGFLSIQEYKTSAESFGDAGSPCNLVDYRMSGGGSTGCQMRDSRSESTLPEQLRLIAINAWKQAVAQSI